jgi:hypothetical protein
MDRPELNRNLDAQVFRDYYWLKRELIAFCRQHGLRASGGKLEIAARIAQFLETGQVQAVERAVCVGRRSGIDWSTATLGPETVIASDYRNTANVRRFFEAQIGSHFAFNVPFQRWVRDHAGLTLGDAVAAWRAMDAARRSGAEKPEIGQQFEYNRYMRDFMADNPDKSTRDARRYWMLKKARRGPRVYSRADLELS